MTMDKQMRKNIEEYSKRIETLETFVDAVRQMPGMYIGHIGTRGFMNMIREIFQNSVDQMISDLSPCDEIRMTYDEVSQEVIVEDNGLGIPHADMLRIFTEQHTGSNFKKEEGQFSSGLHGVGAKVTNALCSEFVVESFIFGEGKRLEFEDGFPLTEEPTDIKENMIEQGTRITFKPAIDIMGEFHLPGTDVFELVRTITSLTNKGSTVYFKCVTREGKLIDEKIVNEDGIFSNIIMMTEKPLLKPVYMSHSQGDKKMEVAFTYDVDDKEGEESIVAFSNFCPTSAGTHIDGFEEGMGAYFRDYMNNVFLGKNVKYRVNINDIRSGLRAVVNVAHLEPIFDGQSKDVLSNEDMRGYMRDKVRDELDKWAQSHPNQLRRVANYLKEVAEIRHKSEEGRVKLSTKYNKSVVSGLPEKYEKPTGKKDLELIIVEGDSAGGSAKNARCAKRQGIFPIRGKLVNAFSSTRDRVLNNTEIAGIINIIDAGYGRNFDIDKVKFDKIVFMTDADADGAHINVLLLGLFLMYMRPLVEAGKVYKANPPLYGVQEGKETKYFRDRLAYVEYTQEKFSRDHTIELSNSSAKMTDSDIQGLLYNNMDYSYELDVVSNTYAVNPLLLEMVLGNRELSDSELQKLLRERYRFIEVNTEKGVRIISGLADDKMQSLFLNDRFMRDAKYVTDYIDNEVMYYKLDGEIVSLYTLLSAFEQYNERAKITRYKGLGEMNADQLRASTIHPDSDRMLMRYTVGQMEADIKKMREIESNKKKLIDDIQVSRHEIMGG